MQLLLFIPVLFLSIVIHECAHGLAALRAGDPTAKWAGRITLNPLPHVDLFGTILLPLFLIITGSPFLFGWAKPVPIDPRNFRDPRKDSIKVSAAGPLSNILLAIFILILAIILALILKQTHSARFLQYFDLMFKGIGINLVLAVFNLIPVPPLDGSHILSNLLPLNWAVTYERMRNLGFILVLLIVVSPLGNIVFLPVRVLYGLFVQIFYFFLR